MFGKIKAGMHAYKSGIDDSFLEFYVLSANILIWLIISFIKFLFLKKKKVKHYGDLSFVRQVSWVRCS